QELGEVTAGPRQAAQADARSVQAEFAFYELQQSPASLAARRREDAGFAAQQGPRLPEDPGISQTAAADGHAVGPRLAQEAQGVGRLADAAAAQYGDADGVLDTG